VVVDRKHSVTGFTVTSFTVTSFTCFSVTSFTVTQRRVGHKFYSVTSFTVTQRGGHGHKFHMGGAGKRKAACQDDTRGEGGSGASGGEGMEGGGSKGKRRPLPARGVLTGTLGFNMNNTLHACVAEI
jgi:hypothetical protein